MSRELTGYAKKRREGRVPLPHSDLYSRWKSAVMAGRRDEAEQLSISHRRRFAAGQTGRLLGHPY